MAPWCPQHRDTYHRMSSFSQLRMASQSFQGANGKAPSGRKRWGSQELVSSRDAYLPLARYLLRTAAGIRPRAGTSTLLAAAHLRTALGS